MEVLVSFPACYCGTRWVFTTIYQLSCFLFWLWLSTCQAYWISGLYNYCKLRIRFVFLIFFNIYSFRSSLQTKIILKVAARQLGKDNALFFKSILQVFNLSQGYVFLTIKEKNKSS